MRNESVLTLEEFKEQMIKQIKQNAPSSNIKKENITIKVKLTEDSEAVNFHSFKVIIDV